ncbi:MAG: tRNA (adenosine(37)-N6)-threonylcarbamoyltransferase complex dimerization subunit type 1 TsaB [Sphingomonadales bacterium]
MFILAIDTSLGACSVAVTDGDRLLAHAFEVLGRGHAERLVPMVQDVMTTAALPFTDLDLIAVTVGPGAFTGVRIGLAAARGFALAHGVPVVGVTSTEAVAAALFRGADTARLPDHLAVLHDARRGEIYMQVFAHPDPGGIPVASAAATVIARDRVADALPPGPLAIAGTGVAILRDGFSADSNRILIDEPGYPDARDVAWIAARRGPSPGPVRPLYLRPPDAKLPGAKLPTSSAPGR